MRETPRLLAWAGALSVATSIVHGALVNEHLTEWWGYGVFFMLAAMGQGLYGFAILASRLVNERWIHEAWAPHARRWFYLGGLAANAGLIVMYLLSRTVGVPLGPSAGEVEPWDALGVQTKLLETALVVLLAALYVGARDAPPLRAAPLSARP